jgi:hypothetical protein
MPTVVELKNLAKKQGLKGYSKLNKSQLLQLLGEAETKPGVQIPLKTVHRPMKAKPKTMFEKKIDTLVNALTQGYEQFRFTPEAYTRLKAFEKKLSLKKTVIPGYLGEAADEYKGMGIFPDKTEYVLRELLDLSINGTRDRKSDLITKEMIERVGKDDLDISQIF